MTIIPLPISNRATVKTAVLHQSTDISDHPIS